MNNILSTNHLFFSSCSLSTIIVYERKEMEYENETCLVVLKNVLKVN